MTVRWGRCLNFKNCKDAGRKQPVPVPKGAAFICPECDGPLLEENADIPSKIRVTPRKKPFSAFMVVVTVSLLLAVGVAGFVIWSSVHGANAAVSKSGPQPILRLAGSNTIGDSLGPALAEAFLKNLGATLIALIASCIILRVGARFAPPLEETT